MEIYLVKAFNQVLANDDYLRRLEALGTPIAKALAHLLSDALLFNTDRFGKGFQPAHDPCTLAWLLWPEIISTKHVNAVIDTREGLTYGATVVDFWEKTDRAPNVQWAYDIDVEAFLERFLTCIERL